MAEVVSMVVACRNIPPFLLTKQLLHNEVGKYRNLKDLLEFEIGFFVAKKFACFAEKMWWMKLVRSVFLSLIL